MLILLTHDLCFTTFMKAYFIVQFENLKLLYYIGTEQKREKENWKAWKNETKRFEKVEETTRKTWRKIQKDASGTATIGNRRNMETMAWWGYRGREKGKKREEKERKRN